MDQQRRGNRGRGRQDDPGSLAAGAGQRSQGDTSRGSRRRRERRWRWANGGIWQQVAFRRTAVFVFQLLQIWLQNLAQFDQEEGAMIYHYDVNVRPEDLPLGSAAPEVSQNDLSTVKAELFRLYAAQFPDRVVAYDGERSLLSPGVLPERDFRVAVHGRVFHVSLKLLKQLVPSLRSGMRADAKVSCDVTPTHLWSEVQGRYVDRHGHYMHSKQALAATFGDRTMIELTISFSISGHIISPYETTQNRKYVNKR